MLLGGLKGSQGGFLCKGQTLQKGRTLCYKPQAGGEASVRPPTAGTGVEKTT